jgi:hypothetical protein
MGRVEQYHTYIVDGYKILSVLVPMGIKLYPYPYPANTQRIDQIVYTLLTFFLLPLILYWELEHKISISSRHVDYAKYLITKVIKVWDAKIL